MKRRLSQKIHPVKSRKAGAKQFNRVKKTKKTKKSSFIVPRLWGLAKRLEHRRIKGKQKKK